MIQITNNGQAILTSNFWECEFSSRGLIAVSMNAGAFRILLPGSLERFIPEMETGEIVIISKGKMHGKKTYEFLFEDGTENPYCIHLDERQFVSLQPLDSEHGKSIIVSLWVRGPQKVMERP